LFELATEYFPTGADTLPEEKRRLILAGYGRETDFFALKGAVEALLISAGISETEFSALVNRQEFHPGRCAEIFARWRGQTYSIGVFGQIHPDVAANFGLPETSAALLDFQVIFKTRRIELLYSPLPKFPAITRDLAVVTDAETPVGNLKKAIYTSVKGILESVKLFDVYTGSQIESGKKSAAFSVVFRAKDRTLTDAEADKAMERILDSLEKLGAKLR
jgi:phenylalanyl-tRNA synthetase beta chain